MLNYVKSFYICIIFATRPKHLSCTHTHTHTHTHTSLSCYQEIPLSKGIKKDSHTDLSET